MKLAGALLAARPPTWNGPQLAGNWDVIWYYTAIHVRYTVVALALGALVALPLGYACHRWSRWYPPVLAATNIVYAVPSIAMFTLLGPWLGYTNDKPIVTAMAMYTLVILVRNIVEGLRGVAPQVTDAARGIGYGPTRRFLTVELPLAMPTVIAGLRLASVSTVSLISVGAVLGRGALGRLFADGIARRITVELWAGVIAVVALALVADIVVLLIGRALTPWTRPTKPRPTKPRPAKPRPAQVAA